MWQNKIKGRIVQKHSVNGIGKFQAEILMETAEGDYKEGKRRWNQAQVIRQDLRNFSGAVQNMVQGVRAASISWGDQNYQMLFRSIQGLSIKSKRVLDSGNRAAQAAERFFEISQEQY